jgi:hypothetical protein
MCNGKDAKITYEAKHLNSNIDLNTDLADIKKISQMEEDILCQKLKICGDVDKARNNK